MYVLWWYRPASMYSETHLSFSNNISMKSIILGLLLTLVFISCQKSTSDPPDPGPVQITGKASWTENGKDLPFQARSFALRTKKNEEKGSFSIGFSVLNQYDILLQSLGFFDIPFNKGNYTLVKDITGYDGLSHDFLGIWRLI